MDSLIRLSKSIIASHHIKPHNVIGHNDVSPDRKADPGVLFPWRKLAEAIIGIFPKYTELEDKKKKLIHAWLDGKINDIIYNEMVTELDKDIEKSKELTDKYDNYDNDLDKKLEKISDIALKAKEIFKSSINSEKHKILKLILSNSQVNGKNLMFSITKPFDKLLFSKGCNAWYCMLSEYRAEYASEIDDLYCLIENLSFQPRLKKVI